MVKYTFFVIKRASFIFAQLFRDLDKNMLAYIQGNITAIRPTEAYVEVNGIGYHAHISLQTYSDIEEKKEVKLFVYLHITENSHTLFGFATEEEKQMFQYLISVSGVGPNTARLILSSMTIEQITRAVANEDDITLKKVKGIGSKTAKQIILDLKGKLNFDVLTADPLDSKVINNSLQEEALSALLALGFQKSKVEKVLAAITKENANMELEQIIKSALQKMTA